MARGKVQPTLRLTYSSADGQREAGIGWGLNIASIERLNVSGGPKFNDPPTGGAVTASTDRFVFGGEPLVPICNIDATGNCKGALKGEVMPSWAKSGWNYFRLEVDDSYERFFWSPDHKTWRVQTKTGETREYGVPTYGTRGEGGIDKDGNGLFRWNLVRRYDTMDNANEIVYVWQNLDDRAVGTSPIASLTDIYDTSLPGAPSDLGSFAHHTQLVWQADPAAVSSILQPRIFRVRPIFRLAQVNVWSMGFERGNNRGLVRSYALTYYKPGSQSVQYARSLLESVQMTGACPNVKDSDGLGVLTFSCGTLPPTKFTYNSASAPTEWSTMSGMVAANSTFVDLDGDGYPDAVSAVNGSETFPNFGQNVHGTRFAPTSPLPVWHTGAADPDEDFFALQGILGAFSFGNWAQVSGAGTDGFYNPPINGGDSAFYVPQNYHGVLSLVNSTYGSVKNPPRNLWCFSDVSRSASQGPFNGVADIDGDGFPDCWSIPQITPAGAPSPYFGLTTQDADGSMHPFTVTSYPVVVLPGFDPTWNFNENDQNPYVSSYTPLLVDVTGDGIPDIVWLWNTLPNPQKAYITVIAGKGDGTFGNGFTIPMPTCGNYWPDSCAVAFVDLNGDGFADFVAMDSLNTTIILSAGITSSGITWGRQFTFPAAPFSNTSSGSPTSEIYGPEAADLNASGVVDLLYVAASAPTTGPTTGFEPGKVNYIDLLSGQPPPLLKTVSNGLGATTTLTYASTASLGYDAASSGHPWGTTSTQSVHVVTTIKTEIADNKAAGGPFVTSYEYQGASTDQYAGAMYDKRFRRFNGFGFVRTSLTSQSKPEIYDVTDTYYEPSLSAVTNYADVPWDALNGLAVFSTRYAMGNDSAVIMPLFSSHTTYKISRLYTGIDGRVVRQVVPEITDRWLYDGAKPSRTGSTTFTPLQDVDDVSAGEPSVSRTRTYKPLAWPSKHTQSTISVDDFGNMTAMNDKGVPGADKVIAQSWNWSPVDGVWVWRSTHTSVKYAGGATDRQYDFTYNSAGQLMETTGSLSGTLVIRENASLTPLNASPQSDPALVLAVMDYDPQFGNLIATSAGSALRLTSYQYDGTYHQLLTKVDLTKFHFTPGSGSQGDLSTSAIYDRGLEVPTQITDAGSGLTDATYDIFGRLTSLHLPDPITPGVADDQSGLTVSYTDAPDGPYQRTDLTRHLGRVAEGNLVILQVSRRSVYTDALGSVAAVVSNGGAQDPAGQWIVSGMTQRDARGSILETYESFFAALTNGLPGSAPPRLPAGTKSVSLSRDPFERIVEGHDLDDKLLGKYVYHDLSLDSYDAKDAKAGATKPTYSTVMLDGHGRPVEWDQRTVNAGGETGKSPDTLQTKVTYLATGEPTVLTRGSVQQGVLYKRWMQYDSLGRMVLNAEPNTSAGFVSEPGKPGSIPQGLKAWMYAYDAIGDLVGTTDARGCGINYTYDFAGREKSEDYIPCTSDQAPYTPVDLSSGAGAEVWNVYDAPEPGELDANSGGAASAPFFLGRLAATYSRGEHTQFAYDGRGRVTSVARQMPNPPGATVVSLGPDGTPRVHPAGPYAPTWYQATVSYDEGDRPTAQSTGAALPGLLGATINVNGSASGGASVITTAYDARNIPTQVSGSYGVLAFGEERDSDGRLLKRSYGDLATTTAEYSYDSRKRLATANISRARPPALWTTPKPGYTVPGGTSFTTPLILQNLSYGYDEVNNPLTIDDVRIVAEWPDGAGPFDATLGYDDLYRLTSVNFAFVPPKKTTKFRPFPALNQIPPFAPSDPAPISFKIPADRLQTQTFAYDWMGDVTASADDDDALLQRSAGTMTYGPDSGPEAVVGPNQLGQGRSASGGYVTTYDAAGNLTSIAANLPGTESEASRLTLTLGYKWDEAGHLMQATRSEFTIRPGSVVITGSSTITNNYLYDGRGIRTWRSSDDTGSTQYYLDIFPSLRVNGAQWNYHPVHGSEDPSGPGGQGRGYSYFVSDYNLTSTNEQVYLMSGGVSYGKLVNDSTLPSPSQQALHTFIEMGDPLGSMSSAIDKETGELAEQITYLASGQTETDYRPKRWNSFREADRYTGKQDDYEVGLTYYGARYFVPGLGRWASPDPLTIHALGSDLNPYSFVQGSPYRYIDAIGLDSQEYSCDSSQQSCPQKPPCENQCTANEDNGPTEYETNPGPFTGYNDTGEGPNLYAKAAAYIPPPPPPTPQPLRNNISNETVPTSSNLNPQGRSDSGPQLGTNTETQNCDSMHTQNCPREISGFVLPHIDITGTFGLFGVETDRLGPRTGFFLIVGDAPEEGGYISGIVEGGPPDWPASVGYEKVITSSKMGLLPKDKGTYFVDVNNPVGVGVMAPLKNVNTLWNEGLKGEYELSPYVFTSLGPIEYGAGADLHVSSNWGWRSFPSQ